MRQYARFKQRHPDCLLLFRIGDFYEMFDDDAVRASKAIGLTLTQRTAGIPMAGVPFHQRATYAASGQSPPPASARNRRPSGR